MKKTACKVDHVKRLFPMVGKKVLFHAFCSERIGVLDEVTGKGRTSVLTWELQDGSKRTKNVLSKDVFRLVLDGIDQIPGVAWRDGLFACYDASHIHTDSGQRDACCNKACFGDEPQPQPRRG